MFDRNNTDDVTDLWGSRLENSPLESSCLSTFHQPEKSVPKLEAWFAVSQGSRTVLSGIIYNHPKIKDGRRISTSTIKDYQVDENGRIYLATQNSKYELGQQLATEGLEPCFGKETIHTSKKY
jgi:hypothetical protein